MSARTILKHVYENGGMTQYQYERIDRVLKEREPKQGECDTCRFYGDMEMCCSCNRYYGDMYAPKGGDEK